MEKTITMPCADEDMTPRLFTMIGEPEEYDGPPDYGCHHCGWMQRSAAAGAGELCRLGTWHNMDAYRKYAQIARDGGQVVPDTPPHFEL